MNFVSRAWKNVNFPGSLPRFTIGCKLKTIVPWWHHKKNLFSWKRCTQSLPLRSHGSTWSIHVQCVNSFIAVACHTTARYAKSEILTHRRIQWGRPGPCLTHIFSISSQFVLWEVVSQTKYCCPPKINHFSPQILGCLVYATILTGCKSGESGKSSLRSGKFLHQSFACGNREVPYWQIVNVCGKYNLFCGTL